MRFSFQILLFLFSIGAAIIIPASASLANKPAEFQIAAVDKQRYCIAIVDYNYAACRKPCRNATTSPCMKQCAKQKKIAKDSCLGKPHTDDKEGGEKAPAH